MKNITPNRLNSQSFLDISFKRDNGDLFVEQKNSSFSLNKVFEKARSKFPERFRGAIFYSEEQFRKNLRETSKIMSRYFSNYEIYWAVKSAPIRKILDLVKDEGFGFDVGSYEELEMSRKTGSNGNKIIHTAPGKFDWDLDSIVKNNCICVSDNLEEISILDELSKKYGKKVKVGIRINPKVRPHTQSKIATGTMKSKFGISSVPQDFLDSLKRFENIKVEVLHMHIGSQVSDPQDYNEALRNIARFYQMFCENGFDIKTLDLGGGYPFKYMDSDKGEGESGFKNYFEKGFEDYVSRLKSVLKEEIRNDSLPCIAIEPGRHVSAGSAFALGYVLNTKKYGNDFRWIMSSISVNDLWHKDLVADTYFDVHLVNRSSSETIPTAIGGTLCFSDDIMTPKNVLVELPDNIERNDILLYRNVGAYSVLGSGNFHNIPRLPILIIDKDGELETIRDQEKVYFEED